MRLRLKVDAELTSESEEIAATLAAFSPDPVPTPPEEVLERSWQRVRRSLSVLDPRRSRGKRGFGRRLQEPQLSSRRRSLPQVSVSTLYGFLEETAKRDVLHPRNWDQRLLAELHRDHPHAEPYNHRPGPLTTEPVDAVAEDPALAAHLDAAERVLTEVSHTEGPLQPETQEQVRRLLLENAVYRQSAEQHGDMETAAVIDDLGRVLNSLDASRQILRETRMLRAPMQYGWRLTWAACCSIFAFFTTTTVPIVNSSSGICRFRRKGIRP